MVVKGTWALVPKGELNWRALTSKCSYAYADGREVQEVYDVGKYWMCPREVFSDSQLNLLQVPVLRIEPAFRKAFGSAANVVSADNAPNERARRAQIQAVDVLLEENGVIQLPPGTGKTAIGLQLAQTLAVPTLIVVHTKDLQQQWVDRAQTVLGLPKDRIGLIGGKAKKWKYEEKDLVVSLIQSLSRTPDKCVPLFSEFGLVIYDEVHHMQGFQFRNGLAICRGRRVGLSATPDCAGLESVFLNHIGPVVYRNDETDLEPEVFFVKTKARLTQQQIARIKVGASLDDDGAERAWTLNEVGTSKINDSILAQVQQCAGQGRKQLLLSDRKEQLRFLHSNLKGSSLLVGDTDADDRAGALHDSDIVCATTQLATEGLDRPELDTLHICLPWAGKRRFVQGVGRILRNHPTKQPPHVYAYDPVDVPMLHRTFGKFRGNVYRYGYRRKSIDGT